MADALVITKADGENLTKARAARYEFQNALHLFPAHPSGWQPPVQLCSAVAQTGITEVWESIQKYTSLLQQTGLFERNRQEQNLYWLHQTIQQGLKDRFYTHPEVAEQLKITEQAVLSGQLSAFKAASDLLKLA
jgi:LAO/AO transport system kinase